MSYETLYEYLFLGVSLWSLFVYKSGVNAGKKKEAKSLPPADIRPEFVLYKSEYFTNNLRSIFDVLFFELSENVVYYIVINLDFPKGRKKFGFSKHETIRLSGNKLVCLNSLCNFLKNLISDYFVRKNLFDLNVNIDMRIYVRQYNCKLVVDFSEGS